MIDNENPFKCRSTRDKKSNNNKLFEYRRTGYDGDDDHDVDNVEIAFF